MILKKYIIAIIWTDTAIAIIICNIRGNDHFYIIILISLNLIMLLFLQGSVPNNYFLYFKSVEYYVGHYNCAAAQYNTIFELKWSFDTQLSP